MLPIEVVRSYQEIIGHLLDEIHQLQMESIEKDNRIRVMHKELDARAADAATPVLVKNGYCTDCGGINLHYDHCLTKRGADVTTDGL